MPHAEGMSVTLSIRSATLAILDGLESRLGAVSSGAVRRAGQRVTVEERGSWPRTWPS